MGKRIQRLLSFLAVLGPGLITANVDNDASGVTTYSLAGARYGYAFLWPLFPSFLLLVMVQEMGARMAVKTGKGLADLIRENFGLRITFYLMVGVLLAGVGTTAAEFAGWSLALGLFGVPKYVAVPAAAALVWILVVRGSYRFVEKVFLVACVLYASYIFSGLLASPPWGEMLKGAIPSISMDPAFLAMLVAFVGTTVSPWMQFYLQASIVEKGVKEEEYRASRLDVVAGSTWTVVIAFFIIVACATTLFPRGIPIRDAGDAALALEPLAGKWSFLLFGLGLANASLFAASILPLSTAYTICEGMGWEGGINKTFSEAPRFFGLYTGMIGISAILVILPSIPLVPLMFFSQVLNGLLIPIVVVMMILLIRKRELMGEMALSRPYHALAWLMAICLIVMSAIFLGSLFFIPLSGF